MDSPSHRVVIGEHNLVQQIRDLLTKSETLANEVSKKDLIINSIEYKMFEVSNRIVKARDFGSWIDETLQEATPEASTNDSSRESLNEQRWSQICEVLKKYMENIGVNDSNFVKNVDQWLSQRQCREIKMEMEANEYKSLMGNIEETVCKFSNVCTVLKKHMKEKRRASEATSATISTTATTATANTAATAATAATVTGTSENACPVERVDEWLTRRKNQELKLLKENEEYKKIIANVEDGLSELDSKINLFTDCLNACEMNVKNGNLPQKVVLHQESSSGNENNLQIFNDQNQNKNINITPNKQNDENRTKNECLDNNSNKKKKRRSLNSNPNKMIEIIEAEIRKFDKESAKFDIKDFTEWLNKLKAKMSELTNDIEAEKKLRSSKDKQHSMEREILNYLFNQKQKEISILKEKVSSKVITLKQTNVPLARVEG